MTSKRMRVEKQVVLVGANNSLSDGEVLHLVKKTTSLPAARLAEENDIKVAKQWQLPWYTGALNEVVVVHCTDNGRRPVLRTTTMQDIKKAVHSFIEQLKQPHFLECNTQDLTKRPPYDFIRCSINKESKLILGDGCVIPVVIQGEMNHLVITTPVVLSPGQDDTCLAGALCSIVAIRKNSFTVCDMFCAPQWVHCFYEKPFSETPFTVEALRRSRSGHLCVVLTDDTDFSDVQTAMKAVVLITQLAQIFPKMVHLDDARLPFCAAYALAHGATSNMPPRGGGKQLDDDTTLRAVRLLHEMSMYYAGLPANGSILMSTTGLPPQSVVLNVSQTADIEPSVSAVPSTVSPSSTVSAAMSTSLTAPLELPVQNTGPLFFAATTICTATNEMNEINATNAMDVESEDGMDDAEKRATDTAAYINRIMSSGPITKSELTGLKRQWHRQQQIAESCKLVYLRGLHQYEEQESTTESSSVDFIPRIATPDAACQPRGSQSLLPAFQGPPPQLPDRQGSPLLQGLPLQLPVQSPVPFQAPDNTSPDYNIPVNIWQKPVPTTIAQRRELLTGAPEDIKKNKECFEMFECVVEEAFAGNSESFQSYVDLMTDMSRPGDEWTFDEFCQRVFKETLATFIANVAVQIIKK